MVIFLQNIYPVYRPASHMDEKWKEITAAKQSYGQIIMLYTKSRPILPPNTKFSCPQQNANNINTNRGRSSWCVDGNPVICIKTVGVYQVASVASENRIENFSFFISVFTACNGQHNSPIYDECQTQSAWVLALP